MPVNPKLSYKENRDWVLSELMKLKFNAKIDSRKCLHARFLIDTEQIVEVVKGHATCIIDLLLTQFPRAQSMKTDNYNSTLNSLTLF